MGDLAAGDAGSRARSDAIAPAGGDTARPRNLTRRLRWIERSVGPLPGRRVLDAGCGAGHYVASLLERGADARGVEIDTAKLAKVRTPAGVRGRLVQGDLERAPFASASFDLVLLNEVLEHVPDDAAALREAFRLLRPGGALVLFAPNRLFPFETHGVYARRSQRRITHTLPGVPWLPLPLGRLWLRYWARNYWPWQLARMLRDQGFAIRRRGFAWPTFEDISGHQPRWMRPLAGAFRAVAALCEHTPGLRAFGSSQLLVACKGEVCG
jgi:SAM-dependent methyltransferase